MMKSKILKKLVNFFEHVYVSLRYGDWNFHFENWNLAKNVQVNLMPYDGWNFSIHFYNIHVCVWYPWCGDIE